MKKLNIAALTLLLLLPTITNSQTKKYVPYGKMNTWCVRYIKESHIIGGKTKVIYNIGPGDTIRENKAYRGFSLLFYKLIKKTSGLDMDAASDFKLLDRRAVDALLAEQ